MRAQREALGDAVDQLPGAIGGVDAALVAQAPAARELLAQADDGVAGVAALWSCGQPIRWSHSKCRPSCSAWPPSTSSVVHIAATADDACWSASQRTAWRPLRGLRIHRAGGHRDLRPPRRCQNRRNASSASRAARTAAQDLAHAWIAPQTPPRKPPTRDATSMPSDARPPHHTPVFRPAHHPYCTLPPQTLHCPPKPATLTLPSKARHSTAPRAVQSNPVYPPPAGADRLARFTCCGR